MTGKKTKILIASLIAILLTGGALTLAYLTDTTEVLNNIFSKSEKFTLEYHANTGDSAEDSKVTVPGKQESYGEGRFNISGDIPTRENYVFRGWNTDKNGEGTNVPRSSTYTTSERHTDLYAQWGIGYTLIYDANGGQNAPNPDTRESSESEETFNIKGPGSMTYKMTVGGTETTEAKVFLGWADSPEAEVPDYSADGKPAYRADDYDGDKDLDLEKTITLNSNKKTKVVYAVWATRFKLIFDANKKYNGSGKVPPTQTKVSTKEEWEFRIIKNNDNNNDPEITPKRTDQNKGYSFGWWCDNPDSRTDGPGTYQYGEPVYVYDETTERFRQDPWRVLYAIYKPPRTLGLYFNGNGGTIQSETFGTYWAAVLTEKQLVDIPNDPDPTRNNYIFMGWSKDKNRKQNLVMSDDIKDRQINGDYNSGDQILIDIWEDSAPTLYAVWRSMHNFRIQFHLNDGSIGYYKDAGQWKTNKDTQGMYYETGYVNTKEEIITENTWPESHFETRGVYATRNPDATNSYKFLGWHSSDKSLTDAQRRALTADDVDYPVELPDSPLDPNGTQSGTPAHGTQGCITKSVTIKDNDVENCTSPTTHYKYMYAVWEKTPLHSYKIIFTNKDVPNNKNLEGVTIKNKVDGRTFSESESASKDNPIVSTKGNVTSIYTISGKKLEKTSLPITDNPSATWGVDELSTSTMIPYAEKTSTATEKYMFKGWSYTPNGSVDITVDADGKIDKPITIEDPNPATCTGEIHYLLLFPVFEAVPQHTFNVYFAPNYNSLTSKGYTKSFQFQWPNNNSWYGMTVSARGDITDIKGNQHKGLSAALLTSNNQDLSVDEWGDVTAEKNWIHNTSTDKVTSKGVRISCLKASNASPSSPEFTFAGWSYGRDGKTPGELTADDVDIAVDENGQLKSDIVLKETDDNVQCTAGEGKIHNIVLYGVWTSEPIHQYSVIFSANMDGAKVMGKKANSSDFEAKSTKTLTNIIDQNGKKYEEIKLAWECDAPAIKIEADTEAKKTWTADEWANIGVYAERANSTKYKYTFLGWSSNPSDKDPATLTEDDVDVSMDDSGKLIVTPVTVEDKHISDCPGNKKHYAVLYAVWKQEEIPPTHTFTVKFDRNQYAVSNTTTYYKYYDETSSTWKTSTDAKYGTYTSGEVEVANNKTYSFDADYWRNTAKGLSATKNNSGVNSFDFVGWSYGREGVQPKNLTKDDVDVTLDDDGFIKDTISLECKDDDCEGGEHEVTLYAIWDPKPLTKTYTLKFDLNTKKGEEDQAGNAPDTMVGEEVYGATTPGAWVNKYTFELEKKKPYYKNMAFVGWAKTKNAMPGEYGHIYDDDNPELADTKRNLLTEYEMTASGNSNASATLYAIWAYEYQMIYDANDGHSAPSMEHEYTNQATHNYTLSENYPERRGYKFIGWSDNSSGKNPAQLDESDVDYYPNNPIFSNDKPKVKVVKADPSGSTSLRIYAVWQAD